MIATSVSAGWLETCYLKVFVGVSEAPSNFCIILYEYIVAMRCKVQLSGSSSSVYVLHNSSQEPDICTQIFNWVRVSLMTLTFTPRLVVEQAGAGFWQSVTWKVLELCANSFAHATSQISNHVLNVHHTIVLVCCDIQEHIYPSGKKKPACFIAPDPTK